MLAETYIFVETERVKLVD